MNSEGRDANRALFLFTRQMATGRNCLAESLGCTKSPLPSMAARARKVT